ncbi:MAG TPA: dynamin family protein [Polyangia bacterium]|nr:dynamin family protein [Polyangia bacterium]
MTAAPPTPSSADARKAAIRAALESLAAAAEQAGLASAARDIRETRIPKLDDERFSVVVLGEFNHGKSTFINALLGEAVLPVGITPTTAVLTHIAHGARPAATLVFGSGRRQSLEPLTAGALTEWLTVEGQAPKNNGAAGADHLHHVEISYPAAILRDRVTIVDTPGVNDINEQRVEITYGYLPRADAAVFLLDATQILTASERQFLEERILRSTRERLIFVVAKADLLDAAELEETMAFARKHLATIVPEPVILPVSAKRALAGKRDESGLPAFEAQLGATVAQERRRLLYDHALGDAGRLASFVRQSLAIRRRSLELPLPELEQRIARAHQRLQNGQKVLEQAARTIQAETAGLKARVRQDLADFAGEFRAALPPEIEKVDGPDVRRYLSFFVQDTWKAWLEAEGERIAAELERLADEVIQVANENVADVARGVTAELGPTDARVEIAVDTLKYDASVFALGALGTTIFFFVNSLAGGLVAAAAPLLAFILRGRVSQEIKAEAKEQAPAAVDRVAAMLGPKLDDFIDSFGARLSEFVAQAGEALARGISEVLDRALAERRAHAAAGAASPDMAAVDGQLGALRAIDERIAEIRQQVWTPDGAGGDGAAAAGAATTSGPPAGA